jgi:hypothetical protein
MLRYTLIVQREKRKSAQIILTLKQNLFKKKEVKTYEEINGIICSSDVSCGLYAGWLQSGTDPGAGPRTAWRTRSAGRAGTAGSAGRTGTAGSNREGLTGSAGSTRSTRSTGTAGSTSTREKILTDGFWGISSPGGYTPSLMKECAVQQINHRDRRDKFQIKKEKFKIMVVDKIIFSLTFNFSL